VRAVRRVPPGAVVVAPQGLGHGDQIAVAYRAAHGGRDRGEKPVTDLVSQGVVDPFEAVEVDEQHRDTRPVRADRCRAREAGVGPSGVAGLELIDGVLQHRIRPRRSDHGGSLPGLIAGLAPTGYRPFFPPGRISRTGGTNRGCKSLNGMPKQAGNCSATPRAKRSGCR
jgi:hypothetical protein